MGKAIGGVEDKFHDFMDPTDVEILRRAWLYLMLFPIGTVAFFHLLRKLQGEFGKSTNFLIKVRGATSIFGRSTNVDWPAEKQTAYMRGLNFGYVKDKFLVMQGSTSAARKMMALYYGVPFVIALGVGMQNYVFNTMSIYLKYQAMVD